MLIDACSPAMTQPPRPQHSERVRASQHCARADVAFFLHSDTHASDRPDESIRQRILGGCQTGRGLLNRQPPCSPELDHDYVGRAAMKSGSGGINADLCAPLHAGLIPCPITWANAVPRREVGQTLAPKGQPGAVDSAVRRKMPSPRRRSATTTPLTSPNISIWANQSSFTS